MRREIRDEAALIRFLERVSRDSHAIDALDGAAAVGARLRARRAADTTAISRAANQLAKAARAAAEIGEATSRIDAQRDAAMMQFVIACVGAVITSAGAGAGGAAASGMAAVETSLRVRANLSDGCPAAADQRYARCIAALNGLPASTRVRSLAGCQATLLMEKSLCLS